MQLKERVLNYTHNHVGDNRADKIWNEVCHDIAYVKVVNYRSYEMRMEKLENE